MSEEKISYDRLNIPTRGTSHSDKLRVFVCPTTGGQIELKVSGNETIQGLKWLIARKLKIVPEKISLLHKNKTLRNGTLHDNLIGEASHITLLPNMESGMTFQRPDASVVQALESLSESQINDFLSGRAPLLLAMRVGDHMMFVQLQLSTSQCAGRRSRQTIKSMATQPSASTGHALFPPATPISPASLAEASRNLSQKLQELSTEKNKHQNLETKAPTRTHSTTASLSSSSSSSSCNHSTPIPPGPLTPPITPPPCSRPATSQTSFTIPPVHPSQTDIAASGAVINSMNHLGRGVFSGTFSGTLDPTLQDQNGKPKKDVSTIVHILNDLLGVNAYQLSHPYVQIRAPVRKPVPVTPSSPVLKKEVVVEKTGDNVILKEKVQHLQMMMQERRMKRKARREMKGPYQWNTEQILTTPVNMYNTLKIETGTTSTSSSSSAQEPNPMDISDNVDTSAYLNSNLEHESLAV
ncbi:midnolin-B [Patella vulgata]|uniref:midnolin-B n=1 Tax=Patella vulgata TaxID=6465 RepID=UPI0024A7B503|nr:midnolin-B [Patella vulgata]